MAAENTADVLVCEINHLLSMEYSGQNIVIDKLEYVLKIYFQ